MVSLLGSLSFNALGRDVGGEGVKLGLLIEDFVEAGLNPITWLAESLRNGRMILHVDVCGSNLGR